ncbi:Transglutaminase-like superfamily protein [Soonwooa buanensis]|uniref:Transglutaminase-like superfamily protein n=1 Tax=Soonwooa buanensis TaxID=619805 RepID=A0A1T5DIW5_9FLAO|nr:DUF3857 domain-containing protein [Soonwooa buanensis]SKB71577.1 Transglutaminase-like superfamily protein [Soonwooa buanensis]
MLKKIIITTATISCCYFFGQQYEAASIPQELKKNANTVVRKDSKLYTISSFDNLNIKFNKASTILNKSGEKNSYVVIHYDKFDKVGSVKVKVFDEFGKQIQSFSKSDFQDVNTTGSSGLYTDNRMLYLEISTPNYPYTIEETYEVNTSNTAFIPEFVPFRSSNIALEKAELKLLNKSGVKLRKKLKETAFARLSQQGSDDDFTLSFENVPALKDEKYSPNINTLLPRVEFSLEKFSLAGKKGDLTTWKDFGIWYNTLLEPVSVITPEIQKEVNDLNLQGTVSEKVKTLYQYMQNKTRYVNVAIGIGGWQPMPADEVRRKGYGDCKGLTNYMRVLLKAAGVPAYYAIIYSDFTPKKFDQDFPKMAGNHIVLMVPTEKGNVWLENTSQKIAFNHIGINNTNRNVLLVKEDGIELMDTPIYKTEDSNEKLKLSAKILEDNSITGDADFNYSGGLYDYMFSLSNSSTDDQKDALKSIFSNLKFQDLAIQKIDNNRDDAKLQLNFDFKANNYSKKMGDDIFFGIVPFGQNSFYLESSEDRISPVEIPFAYHDQYEIEYTLPQNYKIGDLPTPVKLTSEFGEYQLSVSQKEGKIVVERQMKLNKMLLQPTQIKSYQDFRRKISSNDNTKILLTKI